MKSKPRPTAPATTTTYCAAPSGCTTPYDPTKSGEWLRVAGFLTRWSAGTDEVMYEISEETAPVLGADLGVEKMSLLFSAYLAGGAEYALGGGNGRDAAAVARAGGDAVIAVYRANRGTLGKIREVETMIKRRQKER